MSKTVRAGRARSARSTRAIAVGEAVHDLARQLGITRKLREYDVLTSWDAIVGEQIARVAQARRIENGILHVSVKSAPWRAELTMKRTEIAAKINDTFGKKVVKEIRFR